MCKNIFTNENEFDLNGPITKDGVHYFGFGCSQHPTVGCVQFPNFEIDLNGPITDDGVHYYGFGCSQHPTVGCVQFPNFEI